VAATLTIPLDNLLTVGANVSHRGRQNDAYVSVDKGIDGETGLGWRVLAGTRDSAPFSEAGMRLYSEHSLLTADVSASKNQQAVRLGAQTGIVFVGGKTFITQRVQDSFALVQVPGFADVGVGFHGRTLVHTDKDGDALLPRLMPYQSNSISLNASDLPINAELDTIELQAVPSARSAVKIVFPVRSGRGALLRIVFDDGEPAPAGAEVELVGDKAEFFVARRGESFVTGMKDRNTVRLKWKDATCTFEANLPPGALDEIARVGPLACKGVKR
jgi:outer membrane usher protein